MNATEKLLDRYAATCYATKDKEIADRLRVTKQAVSGWRNGHAHPDADSIEKMADAIGEPVGPWLASIEADRARTPANRKVWLRLAATLGTTLAITVTTLPAHTIGRLAVQTARWLSIVSNHARRLARKMKRAVQQAISPLSERTQKMCSMPA